MILMGTLTHKTEGPWGNDTGGTIFDVILHSICIQYVGYLFSLLVSASRLKGELAG